MRNAVPFPRNEQLLPGIRQAQVARLLALPIQSVAERHTLLMHAVQVLKQDRADLKASATPSRTVDDTLVRLTLTVAREINALRAKESGLSDLANQPDRHMSALTGALKTIRATQSSDTGMPSPFLGRLIQGITHSIDTLKDQTLPAAVTARPEAKPPPQPLVSRIIKGAMAVLLATHAIPATTPESPSVSSKPLIQSASATTPTSAPVATAVQAHLRKSDSIHVSASGLSRLVYTPLKSRPVATIKAKVHAVAGSLVPKISAETVLNQTELLKAGVTMLENLPIKQAFAKAVTVESGGRQFDADGNVLTSSKGAQGRSQMLPSTARVIAPQCTGKPLDEARFVSDASYNGRLGECYFNKRASQYGGSNVLAAIAYNYGAGNLEKHIARVGNPAKGEIDMVSFIQSIPNKEARNYVPSILAKGKLLPNKESTQPAKEAEPHPQPAMTQAFEQAGSASPVEQAASSTDAPQVQAEHAPSPTAVTLEASPQ